VEQELVYGEVPAQDADFGDAVRAILEQHANAAALAAFGAAAAPAGAGASRARRVGTLSRFADLMVSEGVVDGRLDDPEVQHRLQKCVYIAQRMGAALGYRFRFLESGAFSTGLAVDIYQRGTARGGSDPFGGDRERAEAFLRLVRDRSDSWLRIATFALCPRGVPSDREGFVDHVVWHDSELDRGLVARVFDDVRSLAGSGGGGQGA